ncbi:hypothetical protein CY35_05G035200 [Sphagnum magellanicum]|nr:hypothetical protein CY35_05G035200 [Sphagnum magellanicum]
MFMKARFVNAQIDRAQICSMTHAETKTFARAWINKDEQTQICFLQGGVGWGVGFSVHVQILVQQLGLGNTMEWVICKKNSGCGVFFLCVDRYLSGALDLATQSS